VEDSESTVQTRVPVSVKNASIEIRLGFVRKVYGILSAQLVLTVLIAAPIVKSSYGVKDEQLEVWSSNHSWMAGMSLFGLLVSMCALICCQSAVRSYPANYIFLFMLTACMSVLVGFTSAMYTWQSVFLATGLTVCIFLSMTIYAWNTTNDFTGYGPYLFGALCTMIAFGFALTLMTMCGIEVKWAMMAYDFMGVLLFTFYIVFDTQMILGDYGGHKHAFSVDDYVFAALNLYLDIINLFLHILSLLGERR